jgi:hypothetical protein
MHQQSIEDKDQFNKEKDEIKKRKNKRIFGGPGIIGHADL